MKEVKYETILKKEENVPVTIVAEGNTDTLPEGTRVQLIQKDGMYCLLDEEGNVVYADLYANINEQKAEHLSFVKAIFTIMKVQGHLLKAEMINPYSLVHHGEAQWSFLHGTV